MTITLVKQKNRQFDSIARRLRVAANLTRQALADLATVPLEHVELFEKGFPVPLDSKRRMYKELWAKKHGK